MISNARHELACAHPLSISVCLRANAHTSSSPSPLPWEGEGNRNGQAFIAVLAQLLFNLPISTFGTPVCRSPRDEGGAILATDKLENGKKPFFYLSILDIKKQ